MTNINKKQITIAVLAVVLSTAMLVSIFTDDSALAKRHHSHKSIHQSIKQHCHQGQRAIIATAGANSTVGTAGNNIAICLNTNNGGNALA